MIHEIFVEEPARFDTLCIILEKELTPTIRSWCAVDPALNGRACEGDIFSDTCVKVIKYCITGFFLRDGRAEPNTDVEGFCKWIYTVARNVKRDYSNSYRERIVLDYSEMEQRLGEDESDDFSTEELGGIFDIVFSLDMSVHKLLAWLAVSVTILSETDRRNVATEMVVNRFAHSTLDEMLAYILCELSRYPALMPSDTEIFDIREKLNMTDDLGLRIGDRPFYSFFMAKGGKYSVSDWLHKINQLVKRRFQW